MAGKLRCELCCADGAGLMAGPRLLRGGWRLLGNGDTRPSLAGALALGCRLLGPAPGDTRPGLAGDTVAGRLVSEALGPCSSDGERTRLSVIGCLRFSTLLLQLAAHLTCLSRSGSVAGSCAARAGWPHERSLAIPPCMPYKQADRHTSCPPSHRSPAHQWVLPVKPCL
jgi:hypothetical protein